MAATHLSARFSIVEEGRALVIERSDTASSSLSALWLLDNADADRDPRNGQKLTNITDLTPDPRILAVEQSSDATVTLTFAPDNKTATHAIESLVSAGSTTMSGRATWNAGDFENGPPKARWSEVSTMDRGLAGWLAEIRAKGFAILTDVPDKPGMVLEVARRIGFVRETNYGRLFDVRAEPDPVNLAYTGLALSVHTDNPYRDPVPGIQLLHCLRNDSAGGDTVLVDGFNAADCLRRDNPAAFDVLSQNWVRFTYRSGDTELTARRPMIGVDDQGEVIEIRFNNRSLAPLDLPSEIMPAFYNAYREFAEILFAPDNALTFKLSPGELFAVDNHRVLHGRTAFSNAGHRHLQGCYVDMDGLLSRLAVLERSTA